MSFGVIYRKRCDRENYGVLGCSSLVGIVCPVSFVH